MEKCKYLDICKLFEDKNISRMPKLIRTFQEQYCCANHEDCARFTLYSHLDPKHIPALMIPNQNDWAQQILSEVAPSVKRNDSIPSEK